MNNKLNYSIEIINGFKRTVMFGHKPLPNMSFGAGKHKGKESTYKGEEAQKILAVTLA